MGVIEIKDTIIGANYHPFEQVGNINGAGIEWLTHQYEPLR